MTNKSKKSDASFLMQGSILALASLISRIVGLIYRVPLTATIGKTGNDFYGTAFDIYNILLIISSYSLPLVVSKLVSARMAKGHVKDAYKVFRGALIFALISGGAMMLLVLFAADFLAGTIFKTPLSAIALRVLAPTILIVAILGVFRGFFQGLGTMVPSAVSQIGEQIVNAFVSVFAAKALFSYGKKVGGVLNNPDDYAAAYGAAGGTLGTCLGALFALIFIFFVFTVYKQVLKKKMKKDTTSENEDYSVIFNTLILTIVPVLLSTTLYNISGILDQGFFKNITNAQGYTTLQISEWWGVFFGQYKVLINLPISIASAMAASTVPSLTAAFNSNDHELTSQKIQMANRFVMIIAFPSAVGMSVLASPIMQLLFNDADKTSALMLIVGSCSIVFYSLSTLSNGILQGIDKLSIPVKNAAIALVAHLVLLVILLYAFDLNIFAVIIANAFYALLMCFLNETAVIKYANTKINIITTFVKPLISAAIMGVFVFVFYKLVFSLVSSFASEKLANGIATLIGILVGCITYFITILLIKGIDEETILKYPGGTKLLRVAKKFHLIK